MPVPKEIVQAKINEVLGRRREKQLALAKQQPSVTPLSPVPIKPPIEPTAAPRGDVEESETKPATKPPPRSGSVSSMIAASLAGYDDY